MAHKTDDVLAKPGHVLCESKAEVTKVVRLPKNYVRGDLGIEPLNIGLISEAVGVSLNQSNWNPEVFNRDSWWFD